jgi:3-dehydroquinate synthase
MQINSFNSKIFVGALDKSNFYELFSKLQPSKVFVLVDENTYKYCLPQLYKLINPEKVYVKKVKQGESNKTINSVVEIWGFLQKNQCDREALLINLGGGIMVDIGGFAASTFKRGISFINIPTTLLSMVDASVGGKTGFNLNDYKNHIGTFSLPAYVFIDSHFLSTLDERQIISGWGEMIKHGLIHDNEHLNQLLRYSPGSADKENMNNLVGRSVQIKNYYVTEDPYEINIRKALNFGHTIGHAVESYMMNKTPLFHGEAIAIGMICELYLSVKITGFPVSIETQLRDYILKYFPHVNFADEDFDMLMSYLVHDKKNKGEKINFTLLKKPGSPVLDQYLKENEIIESLRYYNSLFD